MQVFKTSGLFLLRFQPGLKPCPLTNPEQGHKIFNVGICSYINDLQGCFRRSGKGRDSCPIEMEQDQQEKVPEAAKARVDAEPDKAAAKLVADRVVKLAVREAAAVKAEDEGQVPAAAGGQNNK